jgi:Transposase DDE domain
MELAVSTNGEGYHHALLKSWYNCGQKITQTPSKSSLSAVRDKLSYHFFEEIFRKDLELRRNRQTWRGFHVYVADGDQFDLPASEDILGHGYRGYPTSCNRETHYPKMYTTFIYDVLDECVREFCFSSTQDEVHLARALVNGYEKNSVTIYDRLYCGYETIRAHRVAGNYFLMRARTDGERQYGNGVYNEVREFCRSLRKETTFSWRPVPGFRREYSDYDVRAVKIRHPKTGKLYVFITNLPEEKFSRKEIARLYRRRWEIETSFKDMTCTLKLTQWHSRKLNGILQEIYALLWLVNQVKRQMRSILKRPKRLLDPKYMKANFKLSVRCMMDNLKLLVQGRCQQFFRILNHLMMRTIEKRERDKRSYPRVVKHRGREYKQDNLVTRRSKPLIERH